MLQLTFLQFNFEYELELLQCYIFQSLICIFLIMLQASRAQILKKAADYIQFMRRKNSAHQQDIDDLKRQNLLLESQSKCKHQVYNTYNTLKSLLSLLYT